MSSQTVPRHQDLGYRLIDADNHYYEPYDEFTRFIDPDFADRVINVRVDEKGRESTTSGNVSSGSCESRRRTTSVRPARCARCSHTPTASRVSCTTRSSGDGTTRT